MYGQQSLQDLTFIMLYGGVALLAALAALYLLLRRANAVAPNVNPPKVLRQWASAFFLAVTLSHVWWYVLGVYWLKDDRLVRNIIVIMLDHATLVPLVMGVLLTLLQDRRRPLWPWLLAQVPVVVVAVVGIARHSMFYGYELAHYWQLAIVTVFVAYYIHALWQYGCWLRDNFADLEHKEVWQSLLFAIALFIFYEIYTTNAGELEKEYLAQVLTIVIIGFLLWRVETLQRLDANVELEAEEEDYNYIGALLEERCEAPQLYLEHDLTLARLAVVVGTNRTYLSAYFAQTGTTYNAYINRLRIEHFERLYAKSVAISRPVTAQQLAKESGFHSYSTFSTAFKKLRGITVAAWMQQGQGGKRTVLSALMLLLVTPFCYAHGYTLADANHIIVILIIIVITLIVLGCYSMHHNRVVSQRNEQLRRILTALDNYRAMVGDGILTLDEQEEILKKKLSKPKEAKMAQRDEEQNFFVKMDARINKEKPFTDPDFDHAALVKFMGVSHETFCKLVPRYKDPDRTLDYINSLRAEYAAKILMEHSDYSIDDIASMCGFKNTAAYNSAFKFSFGITHTDFLGSMNQMFKKQENELPVL